MLQLGGYGMCTFIGFTEVLAVVLLQQLHPLQTSAKSVQRSLISTQVSHAFQQKWKQNLSFMVTLLAGHSTHPKFQYNRDAHILKHKVSPTRKAHSEICLPWEEALKTFSFKTNIGLPD